MEITCSKLAAIFF